MGAAAASMTEMEEEAPGSKAWPDVRDERAESEATPLSGSGAIHDRNHGKRA